MIKIPFYRNKHVVIVGLGRTGNSAVRALQASGAHVIAWDDKEDNRFSAMSQGVAVQPLDQIKWDQCEALILSPGIPHHYPLPHPAATYARQHQIPIICDIDLLARARPQAKYIGITGTNGKSTTTALIGQLMQVASIPCLVGGNIGNPVLEFDSLPEPERYVLELSSYQLERAPHLCIDTAVWLNITPDHIERHGNLRGYIDAKTNIFKPKGEFQKVAIGIDDPESDRIYERLRLDASKVVIPVSVTRQLARGIFVHKGMLVDTFFSKGEIVDLASLSQLKGLHNWQNIALAYAAISLEKIPFHLEALISFKGLPHRQELCGQKDGIQFINDSKATNIDSTLKALSCYPHVYLILGGVPKENLLNGIDAYKDRIRGVYLMGQASHVFAEILKKLGIPYQHCSVLKSAVEHAMTDARASSLKSKTILLSPACASFDQFQDFEQRGDHFKDVVKELLST